MNSEPESQPSTFPPAGRVWRRWRSVLWPAGLATVAALLYGTLLDFRGFGPGTAASLEAGRTLLANLPSPDPNTLATPHPLFDLVAGLVGSSPHAAGLFAFASIVAAIATLPAVWGLGRKLGGLPTAACAAATLVVLPQTAGLATAFVPATIFVFLWSWFLRLLVVERHRWWSTPLLWLLGAGLLAMWPMFLAWGALWLYVEIGEAGTRPAAPKTDDRPVSLPGELPQASVPFVIVLAPVAVVVLTTALHPGFWSAPIEGWRQFLRHAVTWTGPALSLDGTLYEHARPPLWIGLRLGWWMLPALAAFGSLAGWLVVVRGSDRDERPGRLTRKMAIWGLPFALILPWIHRGIAFGEISFLHVALPFLALTAGHAIARGFRACRAFLSSWIAPTYAGVVGGLAVATALVAVATLTLRSHPTEGAYYNKLAGGFTAAVDRGLPVDRDDVYPLDTLHRAQRRIGRAKLYAPGAANLLEAYRRTGLMRGIRTTDDPGSADALVRRLRTFEPGLDGADANPGALVEVGPGTEALLSIDGVPTYWLERPGS